ncbi:fatty acid desaturase family protein [Massilia soli]|uniref:Fatty acid desaturase n=1 Tax=Massilia soli TaxID=2792854 RepID=A0ABS7SKX0_9BURK|nr:fatty acid desaturase [Massilia soli]MBZ2206446.1 fatty acid desaturase [Massilia soli]
MTTQSTAIFAPDLPQQANLLRPAVLAEASALSADARREIMALSGARPVRFAAELALTWASIAAFIAAGVYFDHLAVTLVCIFLIGTRQMALALLLHEQVHRLGMRSKYADWFINVFAVYPLFVTTVEDYAKVHLSHHKYCFTQDDPDFLRKAGDEWTFPKSLGQLVMIAVKDLTAMNLIRLIRGKTAPRTDEFTRRNPSPKWLRIAFFAVAAGVLTAVGGWTVFLIYWVVPAMTVTQLMVRWIAVCEHEYNIENGTIHETTPLIQLTWWQRALMPDLNFGLHAYHHMHPGVSFANLPKVHEIYKREGLVDESAIFHGQGAYLKHLLAR